MSEYTLGCVSEHVTVSLDVRIARAMAADQGEETLEWAWPIETGVPKDL